MPTKLASIRRERTARARSSDSHKSGWKNVQSTRRVAKKTKLAIIVFSLIFGLLILAQVVKFTKALYNPWGESKLQRSFTWQGDFNINLVIRAKDISLLEFNPQDQKITIIHLPDSIYLEATHGFGNWMLSSIYDLGQTQKNIGGGNLLKASISALFGLPIDGFLDFSNQYGQKSGVQIINEVREDFVAGFAQAYNVKTDLTPLELFKLKLGLASVRFDKVQRIDLGKLGVSNEENLADGTTVSIVDPMQLDATLSNLTDPIIQSEHKTIALFNATDHPQLAQKWARLITNLGADVIITTNSQEKLQKTVVVGEKSRTLDRLKQIFEPACSTGKNEGGCGKINTKLEDISSRAQINIFLGEDLSSL
ncbi:LCP family protein [Candidatus Daviesbacteria bacterium]|nr:LCP family protein [Candidatus Daviesbacteria bacterium]